MMRKWKCFSINKSTIPYHEEMVSYDVTALFTSTPIKQAITIIGKQLAKDSTLDKRTQGSPHKFKLVMKWWTGRVQGSGRSAPGIKKK